MWVLVGEGVEGEVFGDTYSPRTGLRGLRNEGVSPDTSGEDMSRRTSSQIRVSHYERYTVPSRYSGNKLISQYVT